MKTFFSLYTVNSKKIEIAMKQIISSVDVVPSGTVANPDPFKLYYRYGDFENMLKEESIGVRLVGEGPRPSCEGLYLLYLSNSESHWILNLMPFPRAVCVIPRFSLSLSVAVPATHLWLLSVRARSLGTLTCNFRRSLRSSASSCWYSS
ncbi:hypothetical protein HD554DRAFT_2017609 [Boletus coccyginus]|nr:hypothetical protein HD554DRAFT_2017609 [Boletus coccyginus]